MKPIFKPQTEWIPPESFPDLSKYDEIAIDLETKDPELKTMGSGSVTGRGNIVGIAVAVHDWAGYYPIRHEGGGNMDHGMVTRWFSDVLKTPATKIFHNAMYDVCFLRAERYEIQGTIVDTMIAGSLVDENRYRFMVDMAHYAGLIAAGVYPNPVPYADVVTSTTHKSLRGPRGGIILMKAEHEKAINSAIFPGLQGGPLMHVIAAKAVAFKEALSPEFKSYQARVIANADAMAKTLAARGLRIISGGTQSHVMLVDLRSKNLTGKEAEAILGSVHMTVNKNAIPNDPQKPMVTSGVRIGTPALTTRGFGVEEATATAHLIADTLDNPHDEANLAAVREKVAALTARFPVYGG